MSESSDIRSTVRAVEIALINISGERQRTMDAGVEKHIRELSASIKEDGLIHAITLDQQGNLIAGFCRLNAIRLLNEPYYYGGSLIPAGLVPCVSTHLTDEKALRKLELYENLRRRSLTPMDEAKAIASLHDNLTQEFGPEAWGKMDTADTLRELGRASADISTVTNATKVAAYADDEDVKAAKSIPEALKIVEKKENAKLRQSLGAIANIQSGDFKVITGSCIDILPTLENGTFAGIVVDPPYGKDAQNFGEQTGINTHKYDDSKENAFATAETILKVGPIKIKEDGHLYMFCSQENFPQLEEMATAYGWTVFNTPLIWKKHMGHMPWPGYFQRQYECILFARWNNNRKLSRVRSDVFDFAAVKDKLHSAEKPVDLLVELLSLSFLPGETILDPCCGSGSIFPAAKACHLRAIGIELDPDMANIARSRIVEA